MDATRDRDGQDKILSNLIYPEMEVQGVSGGLPKFFMPQALERRELYLAQGCQGAACRSGDVPG